MTSREPLVLAYVVLVLGIASLVGFILRIEDVALPAVGFCVLVAMWHGVAFFLRVRKRRSPAALAPRGKWILGITLGAVFAVVILHFALIAIASKDRAFAEYGGGFLWMTVLGVLTYRAWIVPSARRSGALQIVAVLIGIPQIIINVVNTSRRDSDFAENALFLAFIVICAAGPVLDKLFNDVEDQEPSSVPEARVHR